MEGHHLYMLGSRQYILARTCFCAARLDSTLYCPFSYKALTNEDDLPYNEEMREAVTNDING